MNDSERLQHMRNNIVLILNGRQKTTKKIKEELQNTLNFDDVLKKKVF